MSEFEKIMKLSLFPPTFADVEDHLFDAPGYYAISDGAASQQVAQKLSGATSVHLYDTYSPPLIAAVFTYCVEHDIGLTIYHHPSRPDIDVSDNRKQHINLDEVPYVAQVVLEDPFICPYCGNPFGNGNYCKSCGES
jgi:hypothetical protein